jgi:hypothetical protein
VTVRDGNVHMARQVDSLTLEHGRAKRALAFAGFCVGHERRADHAHRRLVTDMDDRLVGCGGLLNLSGRPIGEPDRLAVNRPQQTGAACNDHAQTGDNSEQDHVAVFFANSHGGKTWAEEVGSGSCRAARQSGRREQMVPVERIELPTFGLQNRCSTAELNRQT